jgi:trigger factor
MKITSQPLPASQIRFNVEVPGDYSRQIYDRIIKDMMRNINVPGFRPGKAPKQLLINHVGMESIKTSLVESLLRDAFKEIVEQTERDGLNPIGKPSVEPEIDDLIKTIEVGSPFSITITTDFDPEVTLGDYKNISVKAGKVEPDPDYVTITLRNFQKKHATLVPVEDRPAQAQDVVTIDSEVINLADNTVIEELSGSEAILDLTDDILQFDLFKMILGMNIGETKEEQLTLPDEFPFEGLEGAEVRAKHRLIDIKYRDLPPLDDEFARTISQKQTLEELKAFLQERAVQAAEEDTAENVENALTYALVQLTEVDLPVTLIEAEQNKLIRQNIKFLATRMGIDEERLIDSLTEDILEQMEEATLDEAIHNAKRSLALTKLAELENLTVPPDRYEAKVAEIKQSLKGSNYDEEILGKVVKETLLQGLAIAWLKENATIELVPEADTESEEEEQPESPDLVHNTDS